MVADLTAAQLALRARALTLSVATTGLTTLAATATGFTRPAGSFVTDGFAPGMELLPAGFADNTPQIVKDVQALALTTEGAPAVDAQAANRSLSVGLPLLRAWDGVDFAPTPGRPYLEEAFVPGTMRNLGLTDGGTLEDTGLYVLRWYGLSDRGLPHLTRPARAFVDLMRPGTAIAVGDGTNVRVRSDVGPTRGQILPGGLGWVCLVLTVPWRLYTLNN